MIEKDELKEELEKASIVVTDSETGFVYYKPAKTALDDRVNLFDAFKLNGFGSMTCRSKIRTFNDILKLKALSANKRFHFYTTTKGNKPFYYNGKVLLGVKSELSEEIRNENKKAFEIGEDYTVVDLDGNAYKKLYFKEPVTFIKELDKNPNSGLTPVGMLDYTKESSVKYIAIEGNVLYQIDCCGYIQSKLFFGKSVNENLAVPYIIRFERNYMDNKYGNRFEPYEIEERAMRYYKEDDMKDGDVILLENTRYRAEETKNGEAFSKELASLCDVFVNDAFGTAHRAHCSNVGVTEYVDTAVVGYLMQKEIDFLGNAVENPERPFVAILGGAKVSSKISVINNLLDKVDTLIIGGGMSYTFTKAQGGSVGASLLEEDYLQYALDMIKKAEEKGVKLLLPVDTIVADEFSNDANTKVVSRDAIPDGWMGLDIGPETAKIFAEAVKSAKTVVWNGPMGCFEMPKFAEGTKVVAEALANTEAVTIIGGGDSAAAVNQLGFGDKMTHISTGGGASLEFLEGKELPGVAAANDK